MDSVSRREFLTAMGMSIAAGGLAGLSVSEAMAQPIEKLAENIPNVILGRTGFETKRLGLGTMFYLIGGVPGGLSDKESDHLLNTAIDLKINVFETGRAYKDAEKRIGRIVPRRRDEIFLSSKTYKRTKKGMLRDIEVSLANLGTDHLDLYMLHDCSSLMEYERAMKKDGAMEGLKQAQKEGKIRFIGITGHSCQAHMTAMRSGEFDVFLLPYNAVSREFERALDLGAKLNCGILCMKPLGFGFQTKYKEEDPLELHETLTDEESLRFVMSHPGVTVPIPGSSTPEYLKRNIALASTFTPLSQDERKNIIARADRITGGICGLCEDKACEKACPNQIPVSTLLSNLQMSQRFYYDSRVLGDQYQVLAHDYLDCDDCGDCEKACPNKFETRSYMKKAHNLFHENRARAMALNTHWGDVR